MRSRSTSRSPEALSLGILLKEGLTQLGEVTEARAQPGCWPRSRLSLAMVGGLIVQVLPQRSRQTRLVFPWPRPHRLPGNGSADHRRHGQPQPATSGRELASLALLAAVGLTWNICAFLWLALESSATTGLSGGLLTSDRARGSQPRGCCCCAWRPLRRSRAMEAFFFKQLLFEPFLGGGLVTALSFADRELGIAPLQRGCPAAHPGRVADGSAPRRQRPELTVGIPPPADGDRCLYETGDMNGEPV